MNHSFYKEAMEDCGKKAIELLRVLLANRVLDKTSPTLAQDARKLVNDYDENRHREHGK